MLPLIDYDPVMMLATRLRDVLPSSGPPLSSEELAAMPPEMVICSPAESILIRARDARIWPGAPFYLPRLPRLSCNLTQAAVIARQKTVTRRLKVPTWARALLRDPATSPEILALLTDRSMPSAYRRRGGARKRPAGLAVVLIRFVRMVNLEDDMTPEECQLEGLPDLSPQEFVTMFCRAMRCDRRAEVARLEWRYV